jgi:hypothetical protein
VVLGSTGRVGDAVVVGAVAPVVAVGVVTSVGPAVGVDCSVVAVAPLSEVVVGAVLVGAGVVGSAVVGAAVVGPAGTSTPAPPLLPVVVAPVGSGRMLR